MQDFASSGARLVQNSLSGHLAYVGRVESTLSQSGEQWRCRLQFNHLESLNAQELRTETLVAKALSRQLNGNICLALRDTVLEIPCICTFPSHKIEKRLKGIVAHGSSSLDSLYEKLPWLTGPVLTSQEADPGIPHSHLAHLIRLVAYDGTKWIRCKLAKLLPATTSYALEQGSMLEGSGPVQISDLQVSLNMGCTNLRPSTNISPQLCWEHPVPNVEPAERRADPFHNQTRKKTLGWETSLLQRRTASSLDVRLSRSVR
jgi:hypothetical protein